MKQEEFNAICDVLEANEFVHITDPEQQGGEWFVEMEYYSEAGEDVVFDAWYDGTMEDFIKAFIEYSDAFNVDSHVELWMDARGTNGVPDTLSGLLEDAKSIKKHLMHTADRLKTLLNSKEGTVCGS